MSLKATPFHYRAVEENRLNAWETRQGFVLATHYGSAAEEALAARFGAVIGDLSWYWTAEFSGGDVEAFASQAFTRNGAALNAGGGFEVLWLNDGGAVRGRGWLVRLSEQKFRLLAPVEDKDWLSYAASLYGVTLREPEPEGLLVLIGPMATKILRAAGIEADPPPQSFSPEDWRGVEITLARFGLGYEIVCNSDDALIVWDRLMRAGRLFALQPAGQDALDALFFESGLLLPGRDFSPARDGFVREPMPQGLGLSGLIDPAHVFNGKAAWEAAGRDLKLTGMLLEGDPGAPYPINHDGRPIGTLLCSRHSAALQGAIGFAVLQSPTPQVELKTGPFTCLAVELPFLALPGDSMSAGATESASPIV